MKHLPRYQKKIDAEILEFDDIVEDSEELQQLAKDLEAEYEEYRASLGSSDYHPVYQRTT